MRARDIRIHDWPAVHRLPRECGARAGCKGQRQHRSARARGGPFFRVPWPEGLDRRGHTPGRRRIGHDEELESKDGSRTGREDPPPATRSDQPVRTRARRNCDREPCVGPRARGDTQHVEPGHRTIKPREVSHRIRSRIPRERKKRQRERQPAACAWHAPGGVSRKDQRAERREEARVFRARRGVVSAGPRSRGAKCSAGIAAQQRMQTGWREKVPQFRVVELVARNRGRDGSDVAVDGRK